MLSTMLPPRTVFRPALRGISDARCSAPSSPSLLRIRSSEGDEGAEHLASLMPRNAGRKTVRGGNIVLSIDGDRVALTAWRVTVAVVQRQGSRLRRGRGDVAASNRVGY